LNNLVVFASGSGSNFQSIIDAITSGQLSARIVGLVTNKNEAYAIERAKNNNIPVLVLNPSDFEDNSEYSEKLLQQLTDWNTDLIVLAGYLRKIPASIIQAFDNRILNIHPALLPKFGGKGFYGMNVHTAVIEQQEVETGCTVHVVTEEYDKGPILGQSKVQVLDTDTPEDLAKRVLTEEHKLYPRVIQSHLETLNQH
jgi:formyltetrahydrofolate-dependent phosphoribosylglycinamide formyltransferase